MRRVQTGSEAIRIGVPNLNLWNVNEPLAARMSAFAAGLQTLRPDIVCLQEVAHDPHTRKRQSALAAASCGLAHAVDNDALSIVSRFPVVRSQSPPLPEAPRDEPRQVLLAEVLIEGRPLLIANTHLAWRPEMIVERKAQVQALLVAIERQGAAHDTKILCGNFNDDPDSPELRAVLESGLGFHDVYTLCHPDDPVSPGRAKTLMSIDRRPGTSAWITYFRPARSHRRIARSCSTAATASASPPII
jgi:endonuclease/exonuclease/phosphatase family metal-dependent hydrolase